MLKRFGLKATVAIVTGYVGKNYPLYRVQPCPFMGIPHLEELIEEGWEIASHSVTHRHFLKAGAELIKEEVLKELLDSKQWIIDNLGVEPTKFAFPADMATSWQIELANEHYDYVRPIPSRADAIIHRIKLNDKGQKVVDSAYDINPKLKKILRIGSGTPTNTRSHTRSHTHTRSREPNWIFLTGCNNSGTTLLDYLLGLHPDIDPLVVESHQIQINGIVTTYPRQFILPSPAVIRRPDGKRLNRVWTENLPVFREPIVEPPIMKYGLQQARKTTDGTLTMGKSQLTMVRMPWTQKHFPRAKFIILVRNGYCVAEGTRRRYNVYLERWKDEAPMTVARAARHWNKAHEVMLNDTKDLRDYAVIRYEDLCRDPADMLRRLVEFFDLPPFDYEEVLAKPIPIFKGYRRHQKIRNMNGESFKNLSEEDITDISREAAPMLKRFGYPVL
ncbi:hypothetical protein LCGC14_0744110 [marine sediment metagenome]|uniref:NodB homology domain-containing protein n=1 Tax=marine sediment metagenome TaxID=412755 RepID=A0A0F9QQZ7_9ZZZZ